MPCILVDWSRGWSCPVGTEINYTLWCVHPLSERAITQGSLSFTTFYQKLGMTFIKTYVIYIS